MNYLNSAASFVVTFIIVYIILVLVKPGFVMMRDNGAYKISVNKALFWSAMIAIVVGLAMMFIPGKNGASGFSYGK